MNDVQKKQISMYREAGYGYSKIAREMGLPLDTIKSFCKRHNLGGFASNRYDQSSPVFICQFCGNPVKQTPGRKKKKFCSDKCRMQWWNSHPQKVNKHANYEIVCQYCKTAFISYGNKNRKYCSHDCYIKDRFGGDNE